MGARGLRQGLPALILSASRRHVSSQLARLGAPVQVAFPRTPSSSTVPKAVWLEDRASELPEMGVPLRLSGNEPD